GQFKLNPPSTIYIDKNKRRPLKDYIKLQGRFSHLTDEDIKLFEEELDDKWRVLLSMFK
ncbi:MAG: pyruvate synthase subunit beta, partial [Pyrobaculum sp.]